MTFTDFIPLTLYLALALGFSFLCSILEAVLLSVGPGYIQSMIDNGSKAGERLQRLKNDLDKSLSAVLTLTTHKSVTLNVDSSSNQAPIIVHFAVVLLYTRYPAILSHREYKR